jgi:hypothetical protein
VRVSERRVVFVGGYMQGWLNHVALCPVVVEAADLGAVVAVELVEHLLDEVLAVMKIFSLLPTAAIGGNAWHLAERLLGARAG